jgi:nitric oxide reductase activation protein
VRARGDNSGDGEGDGPGDGPGEGKGTGKGEESDEEAGKQGKGQGGGRPIEPDLADELKAHACKADEYTPRPAVPRDPHSINLTGVEMDKHPYEQVYASILRNPIHGIAATRAKLLQVLRSLDYVGWSKQEESGRLDRRALTRYATGQANIFSRREVVEADTAAVSVLVDCSASMCGKEIQCAQAIAIQLSAILSKSNASFEVNGFHGGDYSDQVRGSNGNSASTEVVEFIPFKRWTEPLHPGRCEPRVDEPTRK